MYTNFYSLQNKTMDPEKNNLDPVSSITDDKETTDVTDTPNEVQDNNTEEAPAGNDAEEIQEQNPEEAKPNEEGDEKKPEDITEETPKEWEENKDEPNPDDANTDKPNDQEPEVKLTEEEQKVVDKIEDKKDEWTTLTQQEKLVSDLLDDLQKEKVDKKNLQYELEAANRIAEKLREEVVAIKSNTSNMDVPSDVRGLISAYQAYENDRKDEWALIKALEKIYELADIMGWPSMKDSVNSHLEYKKKIMQSFSWSGDSVRTADPVDKNNKLPTSTGWIPVIGNWQGWFTGRRL